MTPSNPYETEIRSLVAERVDAIRNKDIQKLMPGYSHDILAFDVVNPLQNVGADAIKTRMEEWFSSFEGAIDFHVHNLQVTAGEAIGFSYGLNHVAATKKDGGNLDMWWRDTICYYKTEGRWIIVHQHSSVPFDANNGKASLDLKP